VAGIDVPGEARARRFGKQLKIPEISGGPMAIAKHLEMSLQISETGESCLQCAGRACRPIRRHGVLIPWRTG
jgi:hypothetical protein